MYGTVARFRIKPGIEQNLHDLMKSPDGAARQIPGHVQTVVYRMDNDSQDFYMAVIFESKEAYVANANSPDQDAEYRKFTSFLEGEPEWHDGEIVWNGK